MAQYRQSGMERLGLLRGQDIRNGNSNSNNNNNNSDAASSSFDHVSIGINNHNHHKQTRTTRRPVRVKPRQISFFAIALVLAIVLFLSILAVSLLSGYQKEVTKHTNDAQNDEMKSDFHHLIENVSQTTERSSKVLRFGHGSIAYGRDSRYWDKDDRRRDEDYSEDVLEHTEMLAGGDSKGKRQDSKSKTASKTSSNHISFKIPNHTGVELRHEAGRDELKLYEAEYQASLNYGGMSREKNGDVEFRRQHMEADVDDEYDDGLDSHDAQMEDHENRLLGNGEHYDLFDGQIKDGIDPGIKAKEGGISSHEDLSLNSQNSKKMNVNSRHVTGVDGQSTRKSNPEKRVEPKKKAKRRSSCEMKLLNSTSQLVEPLESRKFARFSLKYVEVEEIPKGEEHWEPKFAGHQSLKEREKSFLANDKIMNCGFVNGPKGLPSTGFDLAEDDARYISNCHIAVSSCIFGNSDRLRSPTGKMVTRLSRKNVCFVMFMDEITLQALSLEGQTPDRMGYIGFWKVVVVKNLPYDDMRRVGKIPKLLPHRLFSSARYSIWLDSKLRLQLDPLLILEYFLWRKGYEYAISNHYDRHCLWEEVAQNKKLNKYNHTVIDRQFAFYQADGLKRFNASDPNKLLPSNVPEGSFIVRAHTPMSNLFSCLWFNEVDRFTPRDQLSFAYTYQKLRRMNPEKVFRLNMFKDCERRAIAKLFHHRSDEKRKIAR